MAFIEISRFDKDFNVERTQQHDTFYRLTYIISGQKEYTIEGKTYLARAKTFVLLPQGIKYSHKSFSGVQLNISFDGTYLDIIDETILRHCFSNRLIELYCDDEQRLILEKLVKDVQEEYHLNIKQDNLLLKILMSELIVRLYRFMLDSNSVMPSGGSKIIYDVKQYIDVNFANCTLEGLAKMFYVSASHLSREFKRNFQTNISEYIIAKKVGQAANLLKNTKQSIERIATECGFSSANYFGLRFKSEMGASPTAYRKQRNQAT